LPSTEMTVLSGRSEAKKRKKKGPRSDEQKLMDSEHGRERGDDEEDDEDVTVEFNTSNGNSSSISASAGQKGPKSSSWPKYEVLSNDVENE